MQELVSIKDKLKHPNVDYSFLRETALEYVRKWAGEEWTDHNAHDPGITLLEVLCYALTDLSYRTTFFDVADHLANNLERPEMATLRNFFTARDILTNQPINEADFRKLLMDVFVRETIGEDVEVKAGVKNAWISVAQRAEIPFYLRPKLKAFRFEPHPGWSDEEKADHLLQPKLLFDVLIEFDELPPEVEEWIELGSLNTNILKKTVPLGPHPPDPALDDLQVMIRITFPWWYEGGLDWSDCEAIKKNIQDIELFFKNLPDGYVLEEPVVEAGEIVELNGYLAGTGNVIPGLEEIRDKINAAILNDIGTLVRTITIEHHPPDPMLEGLEITITIFLNWTCGLAFGWKSQLGVGDLVRDVELDFEHLPPGYIIEPPVVQDGLIAELKGVNTAACNEIPGLELIRQRINETILAALDELNFLTLVGKYQYKYRLIQQIVARLRATLQSHRNLSEDYLGLFSVKVEEILLDAAIELETDVSPALVEAKIYHEVGKFLAPTVYFYSLDELWKNEINEYPADALFEGPALRHGFILEEELKKAERRRYIHNSDLIQIIMDVPGVRQVNDLEIANIPVPGEVPSKRSKWCLELAFEQNYIPKLNHARSRLTLFKGGLPCVRDETAVERELLRLDKNERPQKLPDQDIVVDLEIPKGTFRNLGQYHSLQNLLPFTYGLSRDGLPPGAGELRQAQRQQLKAYLLFFEQVLANYLAQLAHLKDLFSINASDRRTYFTQALCHLVPDAVSLYSDPARHPAILNRLWESDEEALERRNRLLDHLLARFSEKIVRYDSPASSGDDPALLEKAIADKQRYLQDYPRLSAGRGQAFDYTDKSRIWHVDNCPGLEKRLLGLLGMNTKTWESLSFSHYIDIEPSGTEPGYFFIIYDPGSIGQPVPRRLLTGHSVYPTERETALALEKTILCGLFDEHFRMVEAPNHPGQFYLHLYCGEEQMAKTEQHYTADQILQLKKDLVDLFGNEYFNRPDANRKNLAWNGLVYFDLSAPEPDMSAHPPAYHFTLDLKREEEVLLHSEFEGQGIEGEDLDAVRRRQQRHIQAAWESIFSEGTREERYVFANIDGAYHLQLTNEAGEQLGLSTQSGFNELNAREVNSAGEVTISGSSGFDGSYTVDEAIAEMQYLRIKAEEIILHEMPPEIHGQLSIILSFELNPSVLQNNTFLVEGDLSDYLYVAQSVRVSNGGDFDGDYEIETIEFNGSYTQIQVSGELPEGNLPAGAVLTYENVFEMDNLSSSTGTNNYDTFIVLGNADIRFREEVLEYIRHLSGKRRQYLEYEGMHLVEHLLLRPKLQYYLVPVEADTLQENLSDYGVLKLDEDHQFEIVQVNAASCSVAITSTQVQETKTKIEQAGETAIADSAGGTNDAVYLIEEVLVEGSNTLRVVFQSVKREVGQPFFPLYVDPVTGAMPLNDPYSFMVTAVLPGWPERFRKIDSRRFVEQHLREQTPAHLGLHVCWVNEEQMADFERASKAFFREHANDPADPASWTEAQIRLIEVLGQLRNVYPAGRLYSAQHQEEHQYAIVLNNSALGTSNL